MNFAAYEVIMAAASTSKANRAFTTVSPDHSSGFCVRRHRSNLWLVRLFSHVDHADSWESSSADAP